MRYATALGAVCLSVCALGAPIAPAQQAHTRHDAMGAMGAMEIRSSIADGATLTAPPDRIELTFEPPMRLASARLATAEGEIIAVGFAPSVAPSTTATVRFPELLPGHYTLSYGADAGDHVMSGRIRFTVR